MCGSIIQYDVYIYIKFKYIYISIGLRTQPALEKGHDAAQEEEPHAPPGRPEACLVVVWGGWNWVNGRGGNRYICI